MTAIYGLVSTILGVLALFVLVGAGIWAGIVLRERSRVAVVVGLTLLVAARLLAFLIPVIASALDIANLTWLIVQNVASTLIGLAGTVLIVLGAVWAHRDRSTPAPTTDLPPYRP